MKDGGGNSLRPYSQQRPMRTNLALCPRLFDNGQHRSTNRLLVLVPHERPHCIMRILMANLSNSLCNSARAAMMKHHLAMCKRDRAVLSLNDEQSKQKCPTRAVGPQHLSLQSESTEALLHAPTDRRKRAQCMPKPPVTVSRFESQY